MRPVTKIGISRDSLDLSPTVLVDNTGLDLGIKCDYNDTQLIKFYGLSYNLWYSTVSISFSYWYTLPLVDYRWGMGYNSPLYRPSEHILKRDIDLAIKFGTLQASQLRNTAYMAYYCTLNIVLNIICIAMQPFAAHFIYTFSYDSCLQLYM